MAVLATAPSLTLKRHIKASPATLFRAWTQAEGLKHWFTPGGGTVVEAQCGVRVGGRFFIHAVSSTEDFRVGGEYVEVVPDAKLAFTWAWQSTPERVSQVTLTFKPHEGGTMLTLLHEKFFDEAALTGHTSGWNIMLDQMQAHYAGEA